MSPEEKKKQKWDEEGVQAGRFEALRQVVAALRAGDGCPWDRAQTFDSLKPCMINEMTDALAAIHIFQETKDAENLCEELGDVLLQVVLLSQIAEEEGLFSVEDVIRGVSRKMIRRHPHVFAPGKERLQAAGSDGREIPGLWEQIKQAEKTGKTPEQKAREKAEFVVAAAEVRAHLSAECAEPSDGIK